MEYPLTHTNTFVLIRHSDSSPSVCTGEMINNHHHQLRKPRTHTNKHSTQKGSSLTKSFFGDFELQIFFKLKAFLHFKTEFGHKLVEWEEKSVIRIV